MAYSTNYNNDRFLTSSYQSGFPMYNYFRANPLNENQILIYPRQAGYNPYPKYMTISQSPSFVGNDCAVYQNSCDIIKPSTKCYAKTNTINHQP